MSLNDYFNKHGRDETKTVMKTLGASNSFYQFVIYEPKETYIQGSLSNDEVIHASKQNHNLYKHSFVLEQGFDQT